MSNILGPRSALHAVRLVRDPEGLSACGNLLRCRNNSPAAAGRSLLHYTLVLNNCWTTPAPPDIFLSCQWELLRCSAHCQPWQCHDLPVREEYEVNENPHFTFLLEFTGFDPLVSRDSFTLVCLTALRHVYRGMSSSKLLRTLLTCSASKRKGKQQNCWVLALHGGAFRSASETKCLQVQWQVQGEDKNA